MHETYVDKMVSNAKGDSDSVDRRFLNFFKAMKEVNTNLVKDDSEELEEDIFFQQEIHKPNSDKKIPNEVKIDEIEAEYVSICSSKNVGEL